MSLLDRTPPEDGPLAKLKARQAEEDAAYETALADLDRLSSFQVPMEKLAELPAQLEAINQLWAAPEIGGGGFLDRGAIEALRPAIARQQEWNANVVRVLNFFRANETVYMVMRYERGRTLQQQIQMRQDQMSERLVRHVFMHLLNGLREVHTHKLLHLDIKPANIYLRTDGSPVLLDFGAARQTLTTQRPKLAPMYTPGFAAPEQYRDPDRLGPWTDVYGTGASMFACLAAFAPQAADARLHEDHLVSAKRIWAGQYSDNVLEVIDWCLRLDPLERPQSVFALQKAIRDIPPKKPKLTVFGNLKRRLFTEIGA